MRLLKKTGSRGQKEVYNPEDIPPEHTNAGSSIALKIDKVISINLTHSIPDVIRVLEIQTQKTSFVFVIRNRYRTQNGATFAACRKSFIDF